MQEEAPSLGKPVLVLRESTERPEAVLAGTVKLVGTDAAALVKEASLLLHDRAAYRAMSLAHNPYGDGAAAARIRSTWPPSSKALLLRLFAGGAARPGPALILLFKLRR